jgi:predicted dehydrogenase
MKRYDDGNRIARDLIREWRAGGLRGGLTYVRHHCFNGDWRLGLREADLITTNEPYGPSVDAGLVPDWLPPELAEPYVLFVQDSTHGFNLVRFLLDAGDDARVVAAHLGRDHYTGVALLEVGGTRCAIETGALDYPGWDEHTQAYFAGGWIRTSSSPLGLDPSQASVDVFEGGDAPRFVQPLPGSRRSWSYREEATAFIAALRSEEPFASGGEDTLTDVRLGEEAFRHALVAAGVELRSPSGADVGKAEGRLWAT